MIHVEKNLLNEEEKIIKNNNEERINIDIENNWCIIIVIQITKNMILNNFCFS